MSITKLAGWWPEFSENDKRTIGKYIIGGLQLGAGVGLVTTMLNYVKDLKNRDSTAHDDDTLYIMKKKKNKKDDMYKYSSTENKDQPNLNENSNKDKTESDSYFAVPFALTGGIISTMLGYRAIKSLYNKFRARKAQKELDKAQRIFLDTSGYEKLASIIKQAEGGRAVTTGEVLLSSPVLLPMLTALATGAVTVHLLNKNFPIKKLKPKKPRRIEVIDNPNDDIDDYQKQASINNALNDGANEYLLRMTLLTKSNDSDLNKLFKTAAVGNLKEFTKTSADIGFLNALDTLKGADSLETSKDQEELALIAMTKSSSIADCVNLLAAAEFFDRNKNICTKVAALDPKTQETLYKIAGCFGIAIRHEAAEQLGWLDLLESDNLTKEATSLNSLTSLSAGRAADRMLRMMGLQKIMSDDNYKKGDSEDKEESEEDIKDEDDSKTLTDLNANIASDTSGEEADIDNTNSPSRKKDKIKYISNTKTRRGFLSDISEDDIDKIMTP